MLDEAHNTVLHVRGKFVAVKVEGLQLHLRGLFDLADKDGCQFVAQSALSKNEVLQGGSQTGHKDVIASRVVAQGIPLKVECAELV